MNLFKLFVAFFKIGFFTIGGGYAMLPLIQKEVVDENGWLTTDEFLDAIAISQTSPGAVAINISIFIGYKLNGVLGAIACTLGTVLPSLISILAIAMFFYKFKDIEVIKKVFLGIRPAVVAMIASSVYFLGKSLKLKKETVIMAIVSFIIIVFLDVNPVLVILIGGTFSSLYYKYKDDGEDKEGEGE